MGRAGDTHAGPRATPATGLTGGDETHNQMRIQGISESQIFGFSSDSNSLSKIPNIRIDSY